MSGIAGIIGKHRSISISSILAHIMHRGTSEMDILNQQSSSLGAVGIEAIGEKPGPFISPDQRSAIVFDGEIYAASDAQSSTRAGRWILTQYRQRGPALFNDLQGEYALGIVEGDTFLLARDRLGIRPLYYGFRGENLLFASEMKALAPYVDRILEFPPGSYLLSDSGLFPYLPYLPENEVLSDAESSSRKVKQSLANAVGDCLIDGIEPGVWLSGGVDSSVIAALARAQGAHLHTFSAGVQGAPDLAYATMVAAHLGADHHERIYTRDEALDVLEDVIFHLESFDAPLVRSAVANYLVASLASEHVSYVLSGEGGDELFAGYAYQNDIENETELTLSVQEAIASLHNTALQRVDRSAAAHQTRAQLPFLRPDVIQHSLNIPARWKIYGDEPIEKWPLRHALSEHLPDEVIWRKKSKFWQGAGAASLIADHAEHVISNDEFAKERESITNVDIRSKEELLYYQIFRGQFGAGVAEENVGITTHI